MGSLDIARLDQVTAFVRRLNDATQVTGLTISDGYLWHEGDIVARIRCNALDRYEIETPGGQ